MAAKNIKIFIASAGEVKAEREKAILLLNDLRKAHRHLDLEAVEWEYDTVPGSQPGFETVQDAINPKLEQSHIAVFIFYSRIGHYTKVEFDLAQQLGKKFFVLFREGFSPTDEEIAAYSDLLQFKKSLNKTVLHETYTDEKDFYSRLYRSLNVYLYETYPPTAGPLPNEVLKLLRELAQKEDRIKELERLLPASTNTNELQKLTDEIATIKNELAQSEELRQQQNADKAALEQQLATQKESDQLKAQALAAVEKGDYATAENLLQESAKDSIAATASTFYELAKVKELQLKYREAFGDFELAARIAPSNSKYLHDAGHMANKLGFADKALAYYEKSLPLTIVEYGECSSEIAVLYNNLGEACQIKGEYNKAIEYFEQALDILTIIYGKQHMVVASIYDNLGQAHRCKGNFSQAVTYHKEAIIIDKPFFEEGHPNLARDYNNLGLAYNALNDFETALDYFILSLTINRSFYGDRHPNNAAINSNIGYILNTIGEHDKALEYFEQALNIDKGFYGESHPDVAKDYNNLGFTYNRKRECNKAIGFFQLALTIGKKFFGERHPEFAHSYNNLGDSYIQKGDYDIALTYCKEALAIDKFYYGESHPDVAKDYNNLGFLYFCKKEYLQAIEYLEMSLSMLYLFFQPEHPNIVNSQMNLQAAKDAQASQR